MTADELARYRKQMPPCPRCGGPVILSFWDSCGWTMSRAGFRCRCDACRLITPPIIPESAAIAVWLDGPDYIPGMPPGSGWKHRDADRP